MTTVKLFVVKSEFSRGINRLLFNAETTLEQAMEKEPVLKERKIISAQIEDCEVLPYGKSGNKFQVAYTDEVVNIEGKLIGQTSYSNPNDDADYEIKMSDIAEAEGREDDAEFWKSIGQ